jgi:hypothetical protein
MVETGISSRLVFLAEKFQVFDENDLNEFIKIKNMSDKDYYNQTNSDNKELNNLTRRPEIEFIGTKKKIIAIRISEYIGLSKKDSSVIIKVADFVFADMVEADPTEQKIYLQWMLNVFYTSIKLGLYSEAKNLALEDLQRANEYLILFDANKRKTKFKSFCNKTAGLKHILTPSDINQFKTLSQLFDAIDPFIERKSSNMEKALEMFVSRGDAEITFRDRKWTVFIPKTIDAACVVNNHVSWCTAKPGNSNFSNYTSGGSYRLPNGKVSSLYIVFNNEFFAGKSEEVYQFHFESNQLHNRSNQKIDAFKEVISTTNGIDLYFKEELLKLASLKDSIEDNIYIDFLIRFGHSEALFDSYDESTPKILIQKKDVVKMPDISRFKGVETITILRTGLTEIHPSIGNLSNLEMLVLTGNNIKTIPKEIGKLKNLGLINLTENPIESICDEIGELDSSRGGSLYMLFIGESDLSKDNLKKLRNLLPNVKVGHSKIN